MVPYKIVKAPNSDAWVEANGQQYSPGQGQEAREGHNAAPISKCIFIFGGYRECL